MADEYKDLISRFEALNGGGGSKGMATKAASLEERLKSLGALGTGEVRPPSQVEHQRHGGNDGTDEEDEEMAAILREAEREFEHGKAKGSSEKSAAFEEGNALEAEAMMHSLNKATAAAESKFLNTGSVDTGGDSESVLLMQKTEDALKASNGSDPMAAYLSVGAGGGGYGDMDDAMRIVQQAEDEVKYGVDGVVNGMHFPAVPMGKPIAKSMLKSSFSSAASKTTTLGAANVSKEQHYKEEQEDVWCCVCSADAKLRCEGCDQEDAYWCKRCWKEAHAYDEDMRHHKPAPV